MKRVFSSPLAASIIGMAVFMLLVVLYREHTAPRREAQEIWRDHERVISDIAMGKRVNLEKFEDAVHFFERLTKITVPEQSFHFHRHNAYQRILPPLLSRFADGMPRIRIGSIWTKNTTK